ncbi:hypothetical protein NQ314_006576 [Rhamnusium bicolor]|uniref:Uncharacterized protein n=1 Tax=Rhamnusium bicolor TaxID=1586634 RepID=A0AAV8Z0J4_9CUCU|nr:hypothetical protein NQ314_006576 [Rhamnusium bicolor]
MIQVRKVFSKKIYSILSGVYILLLLVIFINVSWPRNSKDLTDLELEEYMNNDFEWDAEFPGQELGSESDDKVSVDLDEEEAEDMPLAEGSFQSKKTVTKMKEKHLKLYLWLKTKSIEY